MEKIFLKKKKYYFSSDLRLKTRKSQLILDICLKFNSTHYICAAGSKNYLDENAFNNENIKIEYSNYAHPIYKQLYGDFIPNLSTLDLVMNEGPNSWNII